MTTIDEYETKLKELREQRKRLQRDVLHTIIWITGFGILLLLVTPLFSPHWIVTIIFIVIMLCLLYMLIYLHVFDSRLLEKITWVKGAMSASGGFPMDYGLEQLMKKDRKDD